MARRGLIRLPFRSFGAGSKAPNHQRIGGKYELLELRCVDAAGTERRLGVRELWWNGGRPRGACCVTLDA
jgi:hypothetical protein